MNTTFATFIDIVSGVRGLLSRVLDRTTVRGAALALFICSAATSALAQSYTFTTFAGPAGGAGAIDGTGSATRFAYPWGVATDSSGNVYVADTNNHTIRKISPAGEVTTLAGTAGSPGSADGTGSAARFYAPYGVATDSSGNVYVADTANHTIRKISPAGEVTTLAGSAGAWGYGDATGDSALFDRPSGVATDSSGNVYVADTDNHTIRKITPAGQVTTLAGLAKSQGSTNGTGSAARFYSPHGVATDNSGNVYVADYFNHTIRKITPAGAVTTLAGTAGSQGSADGTGSAARFTGPSGVATDSSGNVYVADSSNHTIRKITPAGVVTTPLGTSTDGLPGSTDGTGNNARFYSPRGVATDSSGNVYVADTENDAIRKITPAGVVTTLGGTAASAGSTDGTGNAARFNYPTGVATDSSGNVYVADTDNQTIRKVTPAGQVTTLAGLAGSTAGSTDGTGTTARFNYPTGMATDNSSGNVYVADNSNHTIRKVTPAGQVTTLAGTAGSFGSTDGTGSAALFYYPYGVATDSSGNVYVADSFNHTIRKVNPAGQVTTLAGTAGSFGSTDGTGSAALFYYPQGVATDSSGNVYVADTGNQVIRKITPEGEVTTLAGTAGSFGSTDGTGSAARFYSPRGVATDSSGNVYVADVISHVIRKITPAGEVTTLAGKAGSNGGTNGTGSAALFNSPRGVATDSSGNVYVADQSNHSIRKGRVALADAATIDTATGAINTTRQLGAGAATGTSFSWRITRRPAASSAALSLTTTAAPTFTPDVPDLFEFELTASNGTDVSITRVTLLATCPIITVGPATLPKAFPGVLYSQSISASGSGGSYTYAVTSGALPEGLTLSSAGALTGTPATGGSYSFTVTARDLFGCSGSRSYTLIVNRPPTATSQSVTTPEDVALAITLSGTDADGDSLTYAIVTGPTKGVLSGTGASRNYTPNANATGSDSFTFTVSDGFATSAAATISITMVATVVKAVHLTQLRNEVNALRSLAGLGSASWTDPNPQGVVIKAIHWTELRDRLNEARTALSLPSVAFPTPVTPGAVVRLAHLEAIRAGIP